MRTKNFLNHLILGAIMLTTYKVMGQSTTPGNVAGGINDFLGWNTNAGNNFPLQVRHDLNWRIEWYTNAIRRMLLSPRLVGQSVNGYTGLDLSGHLGLGNFTNLPGGPPPLTMIHLDNLGTEVAGYRPWMHTGVGMSDASEWMYVGLKCEAADRRSVLITELAARFDVLNGPLLVERRSYDGVMT
jgi:hypothetical protein